MVTLATILVVAVVCIVGDEANRTSGTEVAQNVWDHLPNTACFQSLPIHDFRTSSEIEKHFDIRKLPPASKRCVLNY